MSDFGFKLKNLLIGADVPQVEMVVVKDPISGDTSSSMEVYPATLLMKQIKKLLVSELLQDEDLPVDVEHPHHEQHVAEAEMRNELRAELREKVGN
jgi:hypothetical protein